MTSINRETKLTYKRPVNFEPKKKVLDRVFNHNGIEYGVFKHATKRMTAGRMEIKRLSA
jgi:hypothetical protein